MRQTGFTIRDLIPRTGLFPNYITSVSRLCDSPGLYHVGSLLAALSACVCPHCIGILRHAGRARREPLFLWLLLMGESGARKTQSMIKAKAVVMRDPQNKPLGDGPLSARARSALGSRAGLIAMLRVEPNPFIVIDEAAAWFRSNRAAYMHDGAATWCEIYDGQILDSNLVDNVKKNATQDPAPEIRVSLLASGATPNLIGRDGATKPTDWTSGLLARVMILATDPPEDRPGPFSWSPKALQRTRDELQKIVENSKRAGAIRLDDDARQLWDGWLLDLGRRARGLFETHAILLRRLPAFALRIAFLFAVSRGNFRADVDDMNRALRLADLSRDCVLSLDLR